MRLSDIFVLPSPEREGLGIAIIEAMACGLPCILFDSGDVSDILKEGKNGFLVSPGNIKMFATAIAQLMEDDDLYTKMSKEAACIREHFSRIFTLEVQSKSWETVIERALLG